MKIYIPFHIGSGNRGCEGIARGTSNILKVKKEDFFLLNRDDRDNELDKNLGLSTIGELYVKDKRLLVTKILKKMGIECKNYYVNPFKSFFKKISSRDLCLFTGGDLFCYESTIKENCALQEYLLAKGVKTILWGASIEERFLNADIIERLNSFEKIVCRETETLDILNKYGVKKVECYPDPAFTLSPEKCCLPNVFSTSKVIGINISNLVNDDGFSMETMFIKNIRRVIDYIFEETNYSILLIPHVTWERQNDIKICEAVKNLYFDERRLSILDVKDLSYLNIRYVISNCDIFVGGRTHSVISAYSTEVPTLALGYSIKAKGILKDLGMSTEDLLFDSKNIKSETQLLDKFCYLLENKDAIRSHLHRVLPEYKEKAMSAKNVIKDYF